MRTSAILQGRHGHPSALRAFTPVDPNGSVTRSDLAFALDHYRQAFAAGN